jgi:hypothetical protein
MNRTAAGILVGAAFVVVGVVVALKASTLATHWVIIGPNAWCWTGDPGKEQAYRRPRRSLRVCSCRPPCRFNGGFSCPIGQWKTTITRIYKSSGVASLVDAEGVRFGVMPRTSTSIDVAEGA